MIGRVGWKKTGLGGVGGGGMGRGAESTNVRYIEIRTE